MLFQQITSNKRKSIGIVIGFILVTILAGAALTYYYYEDVLSGLVLMTIFLAFYIPLSLSKGNETVMKLGGAKKIEGDMLLNTKYKQLVNIVEELSIAANIPMPQVYIVESEALNAFATGTKPENASVAITTGLLEMLDREEIEGVMAHELAHIKNFDIRLTTIALALVSILLLVSNWVVNVGKKSMNNPVSLVLYLIFLLLVPIIGYVLQFALSRNREYLADATAVDITRNPVGLKRALVKLALQPYQENRGNLNSSLNQVYISSPDLNFKSLSKATKYEGIDPKIMNENDILELLKQEKKQAMSTHPRVYDRIKRINDM